MDALLDIFTWLGFGAGAVLATAVVIIFLADGTWLPVRAVVEAGDGGCVVRWFDDNGDVNEAPLSDAQLQQLHGRDMADVFYRRGWRHRMRFTRRSPAVRAVALFAVGLTLMGAIALTVSWVMVFAQG